MAGYDEHVKLLLHGDGVDNGTTITDETGKTVTCVGDVCTKTAVKVFGTASIYFDGSGDYLTLLDSDDWFFDTGDFTIDFRVRFAALPSSTNYAIFFSQHFVSSDRQFFGVYNNDGTYTLRYYIDDVSIFSDPVPGTAFTTDTWYHIALVRSGNNWYLFVDGIQLGSTVENSRTVDNVPAILQIGRHATTHYLNGYLDEYRISKGIARWTSNFTPPTEAYSAEGGDEEESVDNAIFFGMNF